MERALVGSERVRRNAQAGLHEACQQVAACANGTAKQCEAVTPAFGILGNRRWRDGKEHGQRRECVPHGNLRGFRGGHSAYCRHARIAPVAVWRHCERQQPPLGRFSRHAAPVEPSRALPCPATRWRRCMAGAGGLSPFRSLALGPFRLGGFRAGNARRERWRSDARGIQRGARTPATQSAWAAAHNMRLSSSF